MQLLTLMVARQYISFIKTNLKYFFFFRKIVSWRKNELILIVIKIFTKILNIFKNNYLTEQNV